MLFQQILESTSSLLKVDSLGSRNQYLEWLPPSFKAVLIFRKVKSSNKLVRKITKIVVVFNDYLLNVALSDHSFFSKMLLTYILANRLCLVLLQVQNDFGPSKLICSHSNCLGRPQIVMVGPRSMKSDIYLGLGSNHYEDILIKKDLSQFVTPFLNFAVNQVVRQNQIGSDRIRQDQVESGLVIIWSCPKCFGRDQNLLDLSTIGTRPK